MANIIVIGAGVSGLKAAIECAKKGHHVTILEARNRLGGRIYTVFTQNKQIPIEIGAQYWEGYSDNIFFQQYLGNSHIKHLSAEKSLLFQERVTTERYSIENLLPLYRQAQQLIWQDLFTQKITGLTYENAITSCLTQVSQHTHFYWLKKWMEYELKHHSTSLSLPGFPDINYSLEEESSGSWNIEEANFCFIVGGAYKIIEKLAQEALSLAIVILTKKPVLSLCHHAKHVQVKTATENFTADKVISTIPLGVLKNNPAIFSPPLSSNKVQAFNAMGIHSATRVILEFDIPFWPLDCPYIFLEKREKSGLIEFRNGFPLHGKAILQTDSYADVANKLSHHALIQTILSDLKKVFPKAKEPRDKLIYHWSQDPYAQGAYPYRTIEMNESLQQALTQPEGHIHFAGADFCRLGFSAHNAFASGIRCASEVCDLLQHFPA